METGSSGYPIIGDESYLDPYKNAVRDLPQELSDFALLITDNPAQERRLVEVRAEIDQRMSLLQQGIDLHRVHQEDSAIHDLRLWNDGAAAATAQLLSIVDWDILEMPLCMHTVSDFELGKMILAVSSLWIQFTSRVKYL